MQNKLAFVIGLVGGILMISAGAVGGLGFWNLLPLLLSVLGLPAEFVWLVDTVLAVLAVIAGLGGIAVVLGSFLFVGNRVRLGKFVISLGAGMGLFGLVVLLGGQFVVGTLTVTWPLAVLEAPGFVGALLSIVARMKAKSS